MVEDKERGLPMSIRILLVEDDASLARSITRGLSDEGFDVSGVSDGHSALATLERDVYSLIILDWWLPESDGLFVLRRFRERGGLTPVLFLTSRDTVSDRVIGLDAGADDYLCKPFAFEELLARSRALIRRGEIHVSTEMTYRDLRINLVAQRAERAGRVLDLTAKEIALLAFFVRHAGQTLSKSRIYAGVWGEEYDFATNTIEVHIKELRRKTEAYGSRLIQTHRGFGYILCEAASLSAETVT